MLRDNIIKEQTKSAFDDVFRAKIVSGQNMDTVTRKHCRELDHFVVFSSIACGRGNVGQSNYGMANSALEKLCEKRQRENLPGLAIQWGPIGEVGTLTKVEAGSLVSFIIKKLSSFANCQLFYMIHFWYYINLKYTCGLMQEVPMSIFCQNELSKIIFR